MAFIVLVLVSHTNPCCHPSPLPLLITANPLPAPSSLNYAGTGTGVTRRRPYRCRPLSIMPVPAPALPNDAHTGAVLSQFCRYRPRHRQMMPVPAPAEIIMPLPGTAVPSEALESRSHECSQEGDFPGTGIGGIRTIPATSLLIDTSAGKEARSRRREVPRLGTYIYAT